MKPLFKDQAALLKKCAEKYKVFKEQDRPQSPRLFRIELGVSKTTINYWKNKKPEYYNTVKHFEDLILADIEQHLLNHAYNKNKANPTPYFFILRAYDRKRYAWETLKEQETPENKKLPVVVLKPDKEEVLLNDKADKDK